MANKWMSLPGGPKAPQNILNHWGSSWGPKQIERNYKKVKRWDSSIEFHKNIDRKKIVFDHYKCWVASLAPRGQLRAPHALFCKNLVIIVLWTYSKSFLEDKTNLILYFENAHFCTGFVSFNWNSVIPLVLVLAKVLLCRHGLTLQTFSGKFGLSS